MNNYKIQQALPGSIFPDPLGVGVVVGRSGGLVDDSDEVNGIRVNPAIDLDLHGTATAGGGSRAPLLSSQVAVGDVVLVTLGFLHGDGRSSSVKIAFSYKVSLHPTSFMLRARQHESLYGAVRWLASLDRGAGRAPAHCGCSRRIAGRSRGIGALRMECC